MKEKRGVSIQSSSSFEIKTSQQEQDSKKKVAVLWIVEKKFLKGHKAKTQPNGGLLT